MIKFIRIADIDFKPVKVDKQFLQDVRAHGIMCPITVRPKGKRYELVIGPKRLDAAKALKHKTIACHVTTDDEFVTFTLQQPTLQQPASLAELGQMVLKLKEIRKESYTELAKLLGQNVRTIYRWVAAARK